MTLCRRKWRAFLLLPALLLAQPAPARASFPTGAEVVLIFVGVGVIGAGVGITVYHFAHKPPSLTGCLGGASGGLTLENESDHRSFLLAGDTGSLQAGERVRVSGKKRNKDGVSTFVVERVRKDYGACPVKPL